MPPEAIDFVSNWEGPLNFREKESLCISSKYFFVYGTLGVSVLIKCFAGKYIALKRELFRGRKGMNAEWGLS